MSRNKDIKKSPYNKFTRAMKKLFGVDHRDWFNSAIIVGATNFTVAKPSFAPSMKLSKIFTRLNNP